MPETKNNPVAEPEEPGLSGLKTLKVGAETKAFFDSLCSRYNITQDEAATIACEAVRRSFLGSSGLANMDLVRAVENLESSVELLAGINVLVADCCAAFVDGRLAVMDRALAQMTSAGDRAKGVSHAGLR